MTGAFSLIAAMALVSGMLPPADDLPVTGTILANQMAQGGYSPAFER